MTSSRGMSVFLTVLTSAQILLYPVAALAQALPEIDSTTTAVLNALSLLNASRLAYYVDMTWYTTIAIICLVWLAFVCGITIAVSLRMMRSQAQSRAMLRAMRASFKVSVTVLFMPLSGVALSWFNCKAVADLVPGGCWGSFHVIVATGFAATSYAALLLSC